LRRSVDRPLDHHIIGWIDEIESIRRILVRSDPLLPGFLGCLGAAGHDQRCGSNGARHDRKWMKLR
jgi:hypothetical protein